MDKKHLEQLAIWVVDNLAPIEMEDMPLIFPKNGETQRRLWNEVCKITRYEE